jgi:hypothetical protein
MKRTIVIFSLIIMGCKDPQNSISFIKDRKHMCTNVVSHLLSKETIGRDGTLCSDDIKMDSLLQRITINLYNPMGAGVGQQIQGDGPLLCSETFQTDSTREVFLSLRPLKTLYIIDEVVNINAVEYDVTCWYSQLKETVIVRGQSYDAHVSISYESRNKNNKHASLRSNFFIPVDAP